MKAKTITDALALAAWELAESESAMLRAEHDMRAARRRQKSAAQKLAELHEEISRELQTIHERIHARH